MYCDLDNHRIVSFATYDFRVKLAKDCRCMIEMPIWIACRQNRYEAPGLPSATIKTRLFADDLLQITARSAKTHLAGFNH
jgi:hypothetical protein